MSCALCHTRKEKRFCPALHQKICPVCCGREREVTLDCPSECPHLQEARRHERRTLDDVDAALLFPRIEIQEQTVYGREPLIAGLSYTLAQAARKDRRLLDQDAIGALSSLARRLETLVSSGLHVPGESIAPAQQALATELEQMIAEYRQTEQQNVGAVSLRDSELLSVLVFLVRTALARTSGRPRSRALLDFLQAQFPDRQPVGAGSGLVVP